MLKKTVAAVGIATLASAGAIDLPEAQAKDTGAQELIQLAACNPCNPCAGANPCNPCNPCAAANPCNPCNPCAAKR